MPQKENDNFVKKNNIKYLLFLLVPLIGFGLYQIKQNDSPEATQINTSEVGEEILSTTKGHVPKESSPSISEAANIQEDTANKGTFTDTRDGQSYKWVRLKDSKKWMAQNLNYKITDTWCYDNKRDNCSKYGRLYTWEAAKKACPNGWRLPTDEEWWIMASYYGKAYNSNPGQQKVEGPDDGEMAYKALIQGGETGFAALLGGSHSSEEGFDYIGDLGCYWSSSENSASNIMGYYFYIHSRGLARDNYHKTLGFSCRCLQD